MGTTSCSDFEEINIDPAAAGAEFIHPDYPLNKSFYEAQMDPDIAERVFVYNWASISRIVGENTLGAGARYSNEYNDRLYSYTSNWVKYATNVFSWLTKTLLPMSTRRASGRMLSSLLEFGA